MEKNNKEVVTPIDEKEWMTEEEIQQQRGSEEFLANSQGTIEGNVQESVNEDVESTDAVKDAQKKLAEEENISSNIEVTEITRLPDVLTIKNNLEIKLPMLPKNTEEEAKKNKEEIC